MADLLGSCSWDEDGVCAFRALDIWGGLTGRVGVGGSGDMGASSRLACITSLGAQSPHLSPSSRRSCEQQVTPKCFEEWKGLVLN